MNLRPKSPALRPLLAAGIAAALAQPAVAANLLPLDRVESTGSRIKRVPLEGAQPVTVLTRADIEKSGVALLGDLVQRLPQAGSAPNTRSEGGDGATYADLRNLGTARVLVLVDGRRWVNSAGGGVIGDAPDLNAIPLAMVERVEVLHDVAGAAYGADAIAGVINVVTRRDFVGAEAHARRGAYDEGDGAEQVYDFSIGARSARAAASFDAAYYQGESVIAGDRGISREPLFGAGLAAGSTSTPMGRFRVRDPNDVTGGQFGAGQPFELFTGSGNNGATVLESNPGGATPGLANFRPFDVATDSYNFAADTALVMPVERWALRATGRYQLTEHVALVGEGWHTTRRSEQLGAAVPLVLTSSGGGLRIDGAAVGVDASNPFNFFGFTLNPDAGALGPGDLHLNNIQRRLVETGGRRSTQHVDLYRFGAGLEGEFKFGRRWYDWNLGYVFSDTQSSDVAYGEFDAARVRRALGPLAECTAPCVPLNLFGGAGSISQAMLDYLGFNAHAALEQRLHIYQANVSGTPFDAPAGPVGVALGYERRRLEATHEPDALVSTGDSSASAVSGLAGDYTVDEGYAEVVIPILAGLPFAELLEISGAVRNSDYSGFGSRNDLKLGAVWRPTPDWTARFTRQTGVRAPDLNEMFRAPVESFPTLVDPCSLSAAQGGTGVVGGLDLTPDSPFEAQLLANCTGAPVNFGPNTFTSQITGPFVPTGGSYGQASSQLTATLGGNPALEGETAESRTLGLRWTPAFVAGLAAEVGWRTLELEGVIESANPGSLLNGCYLGGVQAFCDFVARQASGSIDGINATLVNQGSMEIGTFDLAVEWRDVTLGFVPGRWDFTWQAAYLDRFEVCSASACTDRVRTNDGDNAWPALKWTLGVDWSLGDWEAAWRTRFIGAQTEACASFTAALGFPCSDASSSADGSNRLGAVFYHDAQVSYSLSEWDARLSFGIRNLTDKSPPLSAQAPAFNYDTTTYEVPGRFAYLALAKGF